MTIDQLYIAKWAFVKYYATYFVGPHNADDVAQSVFINLHKRYTDHDYTDLQLKTFTKNECFNLLKKQKRNKKIANIYIEAIISSPCQDIEFDTVYAIHKMINALPKKTKKCIQLFYFEHKTAKEIAEIVGTKV